MSVPSQIPVGMRTVPPGPRQIFPGQHLVTLMRNPLPLLIEAAKYGDVVRLATGRPATYLITQPDAIRDVLVTNHRMFVKSTMLQRLRSGFLGDGLLTSEGELHLRQRRLIQPAFHRQRVSQYARLMVDYAHQTGDRWQAGEVRDIHIEMMRLTMVIVGQALFGTNVESEAPEIGQAINTMLGSSRRLLLPFWEQIQHLPIPSFRETNQAGLLIDQIIRRMIAERRAAEQQGVLDDSHDLLDMLLMARDTEGDQQGMSDKLIRDEVMTLFLAGHETTANALTWTWYLLSQHPEVEAQLHAELAEVLGGRDPGPEDIERLPYLRMVLSESMRLYPPAWIIGRQALQNYPVGDYVIPAGSTVVMSQWVSHRDPRYFPNPERFDPLRWTPEQRAARPRFAYYPFGGGPRVCIGEPFAWMEAILVLAALAQRWQLRLDPAQVIALHPQITLRPKYGMRMKIQPV